MKNREVYKWFGDFFEQRGFKINGRYMVKMDNISMFIFSFECTNTNSVYFRYAYFPFFVPSDFFHYAYGGRLEQIVSGHTSLCIPYETDSSIKDWVELVKRTVDGFILPQFKEIENPYKLQSMLFNGRPILFKGPIMSQYKLLIYLCVMLGNDQKDLMFLVRKSIREVNKSDITESAKRAFEDDVKALISVEFNCKEEREAYFQNIIDITKNKVLGIKAR